MTVTNIESKRVDGPALEPTLPLAQSPIRLKTFILANLDIILQKWDDFAGTVLPDANLTAAELRDHAEQMLREIALELSDSSPTSESAPSQTGEQQLDTAAETHAETRLVSGFSIDQMISEYRALRASVLSLWSDTLQNSTGFEFEDMLRFNGAIDRMLAESVARYSQSVSESNNLFLGILAHDLRTPLGAIGLSAEVMLRSEDIGSRYIKASSRIFNSAKRAQKIVENLLDFTRAHTGGGLPVNLEHVSLKDICENIMEEVGIHHPERIFTFEATGKFEGYFDTSRIQQALCNLVENAAQHGALDSIVSVKLWEETGRLVISVHNDGAPINEEELPYIFDPMTRYSQHAVSERGPRAGLGLGLYITKQIVTAHKGSIDVVSSPNRGTTFYVRLPLTA